MRAYIEGVLHQKVQLTDYTDTAKLPLVFRNVVHVHVLTINGQECLLIEPETIMNLPELRRCYKQTERLTGIQCALYLRKLSYYAKEILLQEGIPFVWEDHQMYLPFLGILLHTQDDRWLKPCTQISFLTQKLLLKALYDRWNGMTVGRAAEALMVSKMSITRCFDEIEVLELPILQVKSRARKLYAESDRKAMWQIIRPFMRNPVIRTFRLTDIPDAGLLMSGISALAEYSMLSDDPCRTVAFEKAQIKELNTAAWKELPLMEEPRCIAHEVGYILPFGSHNAIDPLSVALTLSDEDREDPRIGKCMEEMLEEYVW